MSDAKNIVGWAEGPDMQLTALGSCIIKFPDGAYLVFGGDQQGGLGGHNISVLIQPNGAFTQDVPLMNQKRAYHNACLMNDGRIFTLGGYGAGNTAEIFDPTANSGAGAWTAVASCPSGLGSLGQFAIVGLADNTVLVMGGLDASLSFAGQWAAPVNTVFRYHPGSDTWSTEAPMAHARAGAIAFNISVSGEVIVCGGQDGASSGRSDSEIWNGTSWSSGGTMPGGARVCPIGFSLGPGNNRRVVAGGQPFVNPASEQAAIKSTAIFEDGTGWISGGDMITARSAATLPGQMVAALLSTGQAVIYGGYDNAVNTNALPNSEFWEPMDNNWHALPDVFQTAVDGSQPFFVGTLAWGAPMAIALTNDVVMQVGGDANSNLYAPSSRTFVSKFGSPTTVRHFSSNFVPTSDGAAALALVNVAKAAGYSVVMSGTGGGGVFNGSGDCHTTAADWDHINSWAFLTSPDNLYGFTVKRTNATLVGGAWDGEYSRYSIGGYFSGGTPDANTPPTAANPTNFINGQWFGATQAFLAMADSTPVIVNNVSIWPVFSVSYDSYGDTGHVFFIDPIDPNLSGVLTAWDPDPVAVWGEWDGSFLSSAPPALGLVPHSLPTTYVRLQGTGLKGIQEFQTDPQNGKDLAGRWLWEDVSSPGGHRWPKGYSTLFYGQGTQRTTQPTQTLVTPKDRFVFASNANVPWNGLDPVFPPDGGPNSPNGPFQLELVPVATAAPPTTPPVVTVISPPVGTEIAPTDPISINITSPASLAFAVIKLSVQFPSLGMKEEIFDDRFGYSSDYTGGQKTAITNGFNLANIVRNGGWPASPTFIARVADKAGNVNGD